MAETLTPRKRPAWLILLVIAAVVAVVLLVANAFADGIEDWMSDDGDDTACLIDPDAC